MGVAFAGFLTGGFTPIKEVGLGLVLAVALDATIVRMLVVPATLVLLRRAAWAGPKILRGTRRGELGRHVCRAGRLQWSYPCHDASLDAHSE